MRITDTDRFIRTVQAGSLVALPSLLLLVFAMHFRTLSGLLKFRMAYEPRPPAEVVRGVMALGGQMPLIHDPHIIGYLSLPLFTLCAFGLYALGRPVRPIAAIIGLALTVTGTVYLGGLFGMWTALIHGMGGIDPQFAEGAIATFASQTAPRGAFLLTTSLAKLALFGFVVQILTLWNIRSIPNWAVATAALGCALIIGFWDLDNWMLIGAALMLVGLISIKSSLLHPSIDMTDENHGIAAV
jgi:hypothetical protein